MERILKALGGERAQTANLVRNCARATEYGVFLEESLHLRQT